MVPLAVSLPSRLMLEETKRPFLQAYNLDELNYQAFQNKRDHSDEMTDEGLTILVELDHETSMNVGNVHERQVGEYINRFYQAINNLHA